LKLHTTSLRAKNHRLAPKSDQTSLAKWQSIAAIAASIAIPLILALFGFLVQRQLATEGLKKDYVQIAISILKESSSSQDNEIRNWAVEVLDRNAEIPFSKNAKASLEKGFPLLRTHFIFPDPPESCMKPPSKLKLETLVRTTIKGQYVEIRDQKQFVIDVLNETGKAEQTSLRLTCLQNWIQDVKKSTDELNSKEYGLAPNIPKNPVKSNPVKNVP
jgi:hypothetical protein